MRVAIISDIHDNLVNLDKCLSWCEGNRIEALICCGDITNAETLKHLAERFKGEIHIVQGNMELYSPQDSSLIKNPGYHDYGRIGRFKINSKIAGFCHEPFLISKVLEEGRCEVIFYGHTHKPWIEDKNGVKLVNPGTLGGVFQKATFGVWDSADGSHELKILEMIII